MATKVTNTPARFWGRDVIEMPNILVCGPHIISQSSWIMCDEVSADWFGKNNFSHIIASMMMH